jgi:hypothetical protein
VVLVVSWTTVVADAATVEVGAVVDVAAAVVVVASAVVVVASAVVVVALTVVVVSSTHGVFGFDAEPDSPVSKVPEMDVAPIAVHVTRLAGPGWIVMPGGDVEWNTESDTSEKAPAQLPCNVWAWATAAHTKMMRATMPPPPVSFFMFGFLLVEG